MNTSFFDDKKDGQMITQISHAEWFQLLAMIPHDKNIESLLDSSKKSDRVVGRKLSCLVALGAADPPKLQYLTAHIDRWKRLYFRKQGTDHVSVEVLYNDKQNVPRF